MNASNTSPNNNEDAPLDPAVERVRKKMMRLMGISVAIMMVGLVAVIGAIFYKINAKPKEKPAVGVVTSEQGVPMVGNGAAMATNLDTTKDIAGRIVLPQGAQILSSQMNGGRLLLNVKRGDGEMELWVYDLAANRVFAKIVIE